MKVLVIGFFLFLAAELTVSPVHAAESSVHGDDEACLVDGYKYDCGYVGIDQDECDELDCCWNDSLADTHLCFLKWSVRPSCRNVTGDDDDECGYDGITRYGCEQKGCCYSYSPEHDAPRCYEQPPSTTLAPPTSAPTLPVITTSAPTLAPGPTTSEPAPGPTTSGPGPTTSEPAPGPTTSGPIVYTLATGPTTSGPTLAPGPTVVDMNEANFEDMLAKITRWQTQANKRAMVAERLLQAKERAMMAKYRASG